VGGRALLLGDEGADGADDAEHGAGDDADDGVDQTADDNDSHDEVPSNSLCRGGVMHTRAIYDITSVPVTCQGHHTR
jgi:hypothetical protein